MILTLICALYCLLNRINVDPSHFAVQRSAVFNRDHGSLFEFINHAAIVERWFQWVSHYQSIDHRPPGVGKLYRAYFYIPYIGYEIIHFRVTNYTAHSQITIESSHNFLRPKLEVSLVPLCVEQTLMSIKIIFGQSSLLYQLTIGTYLRYLANKHIEDALQLLDTIR